MTRLGNQGSSIEDYARTRFEELLRDGKLPSLRTLLNRDDFNAEELALELVTLQVEIEAQVKQLRAANEALEAERRKFESIFHGMPVAALVVELASGLISMVNHKSHKLFPARLDGQRNDCALRGLGENRFDQDRISLGLADCRQGTAAEVKSVTLCDGRPGRFVSCDLSMARLDIGPGSSPAVLVIVQPHDRRL